MLKNEVNFWQGKTTETKPLEIFSECQCQINIAETTKDPGKDPGVTVLWLTFNVIRH